MAEITSRAHEVVNRIVALNPNSELMHLAEVVRSSQKFFIGGLDRFAELFRVGSIRDFRLPYKKMIVEARLGYESYVWSVMVAEELSESSWRATVAILMEDKCWNIAKPIVVYRINGELMAPETGDPSQVASIVNAFRGIQATCKAMECQNVKAVTVARKAGITTKSRKGRQTLFQHKILVVSVPGSGSDSERLGGTHASPRLHLRRGHVRRLPSGVTVWVQPCAVGDKSKGMVTKDYVLSADERMQA